MYRYRTLAVPSPLKMAAHKKSNAAMPLELRMLLPYTMPASGKSLSHMCVSQAAMLITVSAQNWANTKIGRTKSTMEVTSIGRPVLKSASCGQHVKSYAQVTGPTRPSRMNPPLT